MITLYGIRITLSTLFTSVRIFLIPFIIFYMVREQWGCALVLFMIAAFTDVVDGTLARVLNEETKLGAYLDPVADKLLIVSCLVAVAWLQPPGLIVPVWLVILVLFKELLLVCGVLAVRVAGFSVEIKPSFFGKSAMVVQVFFVGWLFACYFFGWKPSKTFSVATFLVGFMVVACLLDYMVRYFFQLKQKKII